jgi:hypothetical protein
LVKCGIKSSVLRSYTYNYDKASRLKSATFAGIGSENYSIPNMNYDKNGNITNLQRKGKNGGTFGFVDILTYNYTGNRLNYVNDLISNNEEVGDFRNLNTGTNDYEYWQDGSLKVDRNEQISSIAYDDFLKQASQINLSDGRWIKNYYDGAGSLQKTEYSTAENWDYKGELVLKNGLAFQLNFDEGRAIKTATGWDLEYDHKDHLGNTRISYKANGG